MSPQLYNTAFAYVKRIGYYCPVAVLFDTLGPLCMHVLVDLSIFRPNFLPVSLCGLATTRNGSLFFLSAISCPLRSPVTRVKPVAFGQYIPGDRFSPGIVAWPFFARSASVLGLHGPTPVAAHCYLFGTQKCFPANGFRDMTDAVSSFTPCASHGRYDHFAASDGR